MKVLRNHFDGNPTIFIDDKIINGCQSFTINQLDKVCEEYEVPLKMKQDVLDNYTGKDPTKEEILSFVRDEGEYVRRAVAEQGYGLDNKLYKTVFISSINSAAIPATFHFLAKNASRIRDVKFINDDYEKWDHCDIMIDCVPETIQNVPKGKTIIKIEQPFNKWDNVDHSFKSIKEINPSFIEDLFVGEKKK